MKKAVPTNAVLIPNDAKRVFKGVIYDVYHWQQQFFDDSYETFEMLRRPDTVETICIVDDQLLVLEDEQPHRGTRLSFAGGRVNENEAVIDAAHREVLEETGYAFNNWRLIKVHQPHTKIEWFIYVYVAWDVQSRQSPHPDAGERIIVKRIQLKDVKKLIAENVAYLNEAKDIFEDIHSIKDLLQLPEFGGEVIER